MKGVALFFVSILARLQLHSVRGSAILIEKNEREHELHRFSNAMFEARDDEEEAAHLTSSYFSNGDIRLVPEDDSYSGDNPRSGRLELYIDTLLKGEGSGDDSVGTWGTVCGVGFRLKEAHVACRQLGFSEAIKFELSSNKANSSVPIFLDGVKCSRKDVGHLMRCRASSPTFLNCTHDYDVSVHCNSTPVWKSPYRGQVRLVSANATFGSSSGRVEVYQAEVWGTVCNRDFSQAAADSVCRQLGYTHAAAITDALPGSGLIWVDAVTCDNSAPCFKACYKAHRWSHECNHTQDVAVQCSYDVSQALENKGGNSRKCKISVFPASILVLVIIMVLSFVVAIGCGGAIVFAALRCCYRRKYAPRLYDALE